jgi:hypothetical protein
MAARPNGGGYWLLAADGGIFAFGDASYQGSMPARAIAGTAVGIVASRSGGGYLVAVADGSVQSFGDAPSMGGIRTAVPTWRGRAVGLATTAA